MKSHKFPEELAGVLCAYEAAHDAKTVQWLNSKDLQDSFGLRQVLTIESHRRWMESTEDTLIWGVRAPNGDHVGNVLLKVTDRHNSAYFQIYLGESRVRGQGLGQAALSATLTLAFELYELHRVWLHTFEHNKPAEALYRKNGFIMEGVERDALRASNAYYSQRRWSLLAPEWRNLRKQVLNAP